MNSPANDPGAPAKPEGKTRLIAQTPGLRVVEYLLQPGDMLAWHHHSEVTDRFYCLDGLVGIELRTPPQQTLLHPGETYSVTPGVTHRTGNAGAGTSRYLLIQGGGQYDFITD
jgi:quercetin dioxygenase-like cupin family protein